MKKQLLCLAVFALASVGHAMDSVEKQVLELREQAKREGWHFKIGINPDMYLTDAERYCFKPGKDFGKDAPYVIPTRVGELPKHWDWRDKGVVTGIKDQAYPVYCGSCWAFGTVAVLESIIKIKTGREVHISEQQLVSCRPSYGTCSGGNFAFGFYKQKGANYPEDFPYVADDVSCKDDAAQHEKVSSWGYVGQQGRGPSVDEIKAAIFKYGPVAATVSASGAWSSYKGGLYDACNSNGTNHIIAIVGWDDDDEAWIVKNSHGEQWGDGGYIYMKWKGKNGNKCNNIGADAAFAVYTGG